MRAGDRKRNSMFVIRSGKKKVGFTLIELLVVVLILAVLMAVALPLYLSSVADAETKTCRSNMRTIATAEHAYRVRTRSTYTSSMTELLLDLQTVPACPSLGTYGITVGTPTNGFTVSCTVTGHGSYVPGDGS
jgi:type IV pilus assembly protein PilA